MIIKRKNHQYEFVTEKGVDLKLKAKEHSGRTKKRQSSLPPNLKAYHTPTQQSLQSSIVVIPLLCRKPLALHTLFRNKPKHKTKLIEELMEN